MCSFKQVKRQKVNVRQILSYSARKDRGDFPSPTDQSLLYRKCGVVLFSCTSNELVTQPNKRLSKPKEGTVPFPGRNT